MKEEYGQIEEEKRLVSKKKGYKQDGNYEEYRKDDEKKRKVLGSCLKEEKVERDSRGNQLVN